MHVGNIQHTFPKLEIAQKYIPIVSSVVSAIIIIAKATIVRCVPTKTVQDNTYLRYCAEKRLAECVWGIVPIVGNLYLYAVSRKPAIDNTPPPPTVSVNSVQDNKPNPPPTPLVPLSSPTLPSQPPVSKPAPVPLRRHSRSLSASTLPPTPPAAEPEAITARKHLRKVSNSAPTTPSATPTPSPAAKNAYQMGFVQTYRNAQSGQRRNYRKEIYNNLNPLLSSEQSCRIENHNSTFFKRDALLCFSNEFLFEVQIKATGQVDFVYKKDRVNVTVKNENIQLDLQISPANILNGDVLNIPAGLGKWTTLSLKEEVSKQITFLEYILANLEGIKSRTQI